jgi:hypothetical protein
MGEDYSSAGPDDGQFDKTRWSMVLGAGRVVPRKLWLSYAFVRRRGRSPEDAKTWSDGFLNT